MSTERLVDVGDEDLGAAFLQQLHVFQADVADALHGIGILAHVFVAELGVQRRHQALQGAVGGERRGVARAAMDLVHAGNEIGLLEHPFHVVDVDADVFGRDVAAVQRVDEAAEGAEQRFRLVLGRITDDHALAAAEVQARDRGFVGHAARQAQHIVQGVLLGLVRPHAQSAQRRAEHGVVDRDDRLETGVLVVAEDDFLVTRGRERFENHGTNSRTE
ncbi:MAG: hypothetical protein IPO95_09290 [Rhodanobacteraceae bacterium]|nr:hypothetical protein [Rhodanobacteraceae bacterium]